jgi:excisionase family DNA binding protein
MARTDRAERLHSIVQAAELLGVSRDSIERLMLAGELRWVRVGTRRRIRDSELAAYQDRHDAARRDAARDAELTAERSRQTT